MKSNKRVALFMAFFLFVSSVLPVRESRAAVPLVGLAVAAISNSGAVVSADLLTAGVSSLIGGSIVAIGLYPSDAIAPVRVPLSSDRAVIDSAIPPPSAPSTVPPTVTGGLPSGADAIQAAWCFAATQYEPGSCGSVTSLAQCMASFQGGFSGRYCGVIGGELDGLKYGDGCSGCIGTQQSSSCGAGYVASGSNCLLTNPRLAVSDNKVDIARNGSAFDSSGDIDNLPAYASISGGKLYAQGRNSSGQPVMIEYSVSPDGTKTYITHYTQSEDSSQTMVKTQALTIDSATGTVLNATASTATGSISPVSAPGSIPSVSTGSAVTSGASSQPIVFPSDYARVGEAAQAAQVVKTAVDGVKERLTASETVADPVVPQWVDPWGGTWDGLKGWRLPSHSGVCPSGSFSWNGSVFLIDGHCQLFTDYFSEISAVMSVIWSVLALFIVLGA